VSGAALALDLAAPVSRVLVLDRATSARRHPVPHQLQVPGVARLAELGSARPGGSGLGGPAHAADPVPRCRCESIDAPTPTVGWDRLHVQPPQDRARNWCWSRPAREAGAEVREGTPVSRPCWRDDIAGRVSGVRTLEPLQRSRGRRAGLTPGRGGRHFLGIKSRGRRSTVARLVGAREYDPRPAREPRGVVRLLGRPSRSTGARCTQGPAGSPRRWADQRPADAEPTSPGRTPTGTWSGHESPEAALLDVPSTAPGRWASGHGKGAPGGGARCAARTTPRPRTRDPGGPRVAAGRRTPPGHKRPDHRPGACPTGSADRGHGPQARCGSLGWAAVSETAEPSVAHAQGPRPAAYRGGVLLPPAGPDPRSASEVRRLQRSGCFEAIAATPPRGHGSWPPIAGAEADEPVFSPPHLIRLVGLRGSWH
jgi:hypothetical protein